MPLLVQIDAPLGVTPYSGELPVDLTELRQPLSWDFTRKLQREPLETGQNDSGLLHFDGVQRPHTEASSHVGCQHTFTNQPQQGFANGGTADAELCREG